MLKRIIYITVLIFGVGASTGNAQNPKCSSPSNICLNQNQQNVDGEWYVSHGVHTASSNNAPTSASGGSLNLYSVLNTGNGAFACVDFEQGVQYRVCFWVRNNSGWPSNPFGRLFVYAANGMIDSPNSPPTIPSYTSQLINQDYYGPPQGGAQSPSGLHPWTFISTTFTPNDDYTSIWFYALNPQGPPPPGNALWNRDYRVEVDDIRIEKYPFPNNNYTINGPSSVNPCDGNATLSLNPPIPAGFSATWEADQVTIGTGNSITVSPCKTTIYKVSIYDPRANCASCERVTLYDTITVTPWSDPSRIIGPTSEVPCGTTISLDYNDPGTCSNFTTYTWISPDNVTYNTGTTSSGPFAANDLKAGEWTLRIFNSLKGCSEELKYYLMVGSCCVSVPDFSFTNSNPMTFTNSTTPPPFGTFVGALWDFGDGKTSSQVDPVHVFDINNNQVFTVCLTMIYEDAQGKRCCNQKCSTIVVPPLGSGCVVLADFDYTPVVGGIDEFDFIDLSAGNGTICDHEWVFGNDPPIMTTSPTITHKFNTPGPWQVCHTVHNCIYDANGVEIGRCTDTKCYTVQPTSEPNSGDPRENVLGHEQQDPKQAISGVKSKIHSDEILVYPSPNNGQFSIKLTRYVGVYDVNIRDSKGVLVYNKPHKFIGNPVKIDLPNASSGVYWVEILSGNSRYVKEITIK